MQEIIPLWASENPRWPSEQILAYRTASVSALSVSVVFEGAVQTDSFKQIPFLSLRPGILQFALSRMGCAHTFEQIVGIAASSLSQLTLLQRPIYLFPSLV